MRNKQGLWALPSWRGSLYTESEMNIAADNDAHEIIQTRTVLIVDDNQEVTRALAHLFQRSGSAAATCHSAFEALSYVHNNSAAPAAAVVDIHLPDLSGLVLSQRLRHKLGEQMPIIVLSGDP